MSEVTRILNSIEHGDAKAASELLPVVYEELRRLAAYKMANEAPGHTLQPTALVHEAYLRLAGPDQAQPWHGRGHFFAAAAEPSLRSIDLGQRWQYHPVRSARSRCAFFFVEVLEVQITRKTRGVDDGGQSIL